MGTAYTEHQLEELRSRALSLQHRLSFPHSPAVLWPYLSNTDMVNQQAGLPASTYQFTPDPQGGSRMQVETRNKGLKLVYDELPYEWLAPDRLRVERIFTHGPLAYLCFEVHLEAVAGGAEVTLALNYVPKWPAFIIRWLMQPELNHLVRVYQQIAQTITTESHMPEEVFLDQPKAHETNIQALYQRWQSLSPQSPIPRRLAEYIYTAPERYVGKMRPFDMAHLYHWDRKQTLTFFLIAAQEGFLAPRWDLLCPICKGTKVEKTHLQEIPEHAHCETCARDYTVQFDENLELTFRPTEQVRNIEQMTFCAGGPANTPHLVAQSNVWPNQSQTMFLTLSPGLYRFRALTLPNDLSFQVVPEGGDDRYTLDIAHELPRTEQLQLSRHLTLQINNISPVFHAIQLENLGWAPDIVSAARAASLQEFRDRFSTEVLAPGVQMNLSNQVLLLAHVKPSSQLSSTDSQDIQEPIHRVQSAIREHTGAVVKTLEEQMMAVFQDPLDALAAALQIQAQTKEWNQSHPVEHHMVVKMGLHQGPCVVKNAEGYLDYVGESVDKTVHLQQFSERGQIVLSESIFQAKDIQELLHELHCQVLHRQTSAPDETLYLVSAKK